MNIESRVAFINKDTYYVIDPLYFSWIGRENRAPMQKYEKLIAMHLSLEAIEIAFKINISTKTFKLFIHLHQNNLYALH